MRLTVGPLPASVYWRRRAIVLGGVLLLVFVVALACMEASASGGNDASGQSPSPDPPATRSPEAGGSPGPPATSAAAPDDPSTGQAPPSADGEECTDEEMLVTANASRTDFSPGEAVEFEIRIRNDSGRTCRRDIGGDLRELRLIQGTGANVVWSSQHCGGPTGTNDAELPPGHEEAYRIAWQGRSTDSCDGSEPAGPVVDPGDYRLFARLGELHSEPVELTIR